VKMWLFDFDSVFVDDIWIVFLTLIELGHGLRCCFLEI